MGPWSLEQELIGFTRSSSLADALRELNVIGSAENIVSLTTLSDWHRSGTETFLFSFEIRTSLGSNIALVLKAYTPFFSAQDLSAKHSALLARRALLESNGVTVPRLYAATSAMVLEEFIPSLLTEWLTTSSATERARMIDKLHKLADTLDLLGFAPVSLYADLRTDGHRPYLVDFGEDLGPPAASHQKEYNKSALVHWLDQVVPGA